MRKLIIAAFIGTMVFTSCKKYEVSEPLDLESLPKIKLSGSVYAQLDETKPSGTYDLVPKNKLMVRVSVPYNAYDYNNKSNGYYVKDATITADGKYEVEVPYVSRGVSATISFMDFTHEVKTQNDIGEVRTVLKHFTCADIPISNLGSGKLESAHIKVDAKFNAGVNGPDNSILKPTHNVKISGKLEYYAADTGTAPFIDAQYKPVPEIDELLMVKITITPPLGDSRTYMEYKAVKVTSGIYTIDVPMVKNGTATVVISDERYWDFTGNDAKIAVYKHTLSKMISVPDYKGGTIDQGHTSYIRGAKLYDK